MSSSQFVMPLKAPSLLEHELLQGAELTDIIQAAAWLFLSCQLIRPVIGCKHRKLGGF